MAEEFLSLVFFLLKDNNNVKILIYLSKQEEPCSLRKIARNVGLNHKNTAKYLNNLVELGLVEVVYSAPNITLYKFSEKFKTKEVLETIEKYS